ncbi:MAG: site-2 protease family protein, partial [Muribaculaceae bacterium]|nr:site-2 protease family protein [Muribaculaceae bacterium]
MDILIKAAQLVLALVILVTVHEFGHYIFARIFGVKVNRFYLFFNPWFSLLRYNPMKGTLELGAWNKKDGAPKALKTLQVSKPRNPRPDGKPTWRDTVYGLGWLPLGGYCDIAGMVDETKSADDLASEPQDWELRSKPAWQRLCVMVAGVVLNFVLAIIIYVG